MYHVIFSASSCSIPKEAVRVANCPYRVFTGFAPAAEFAKQLAGATLRVLRTTGGDAAADAQLITTAYGTIIRFRYGYVGWTVKEWEPPIFIRSRNVDDIEVLHGFPSVGTMLADWNSGDPTMGDNVILLATCWGKTVLTGEDNNPVFTAELMARFASGLDADGQSRPMQKQGMEEEDGVR